MTLRAGDVSGLTTTKRRRQRQEKPLPTDETKIRILRERSADASLDSEMRAAFAAEADALAAKLRDERS